MMLSRNITVEKPFCGKLILTINQIQVDKPGYFLNINANPNFQMIEEWVIGLTVKNYLKINGQKLFEN